MTVKISYDPFDKLIASLRNDDLNKEAELLHRMIYKIAWTTGSELIGELGQEIKKISEEKNKSLSHDTKNKIGEAMNMVKRVWPDFPE
jgi:hypothetical protein